MKQTAHSLAVLADTPSEYAPEARDPWDERIARAVLDTRP